MAEHKCNTCFYGKQDKYDFPCVVCEDYNNYVKQDMYTSKADTSEVIDWADDGYYGGSEDYVEKANEAVKQPSHYTYGKYEVIDVIEDWDMNFRLANTIKYIARHKHKGKPLEDLKKALWYLQREIDKYERETK